MQNIEAQAVQNYENNMKFFKQYNEIVYNRVFALEALLNSEQLTPKYDLIYENNYFDVLELQTNTRLYNTNSTEFSHSIVNNISLTKNDQSFRSKRKVNFDDETVEIIKNTNSYTTFADTAEIYNLYNTNITDSMHMNKIDKFIFLGIGLGLQIPYAIKKFDLKVVLLVEDNLELFRLSLFTLDYKKTLSGTTSYFSVGDTLMEFRARFNGFYSGSFFKNQYLKFHIFSSVYEEKIKEIQAILIARPEATYSHNRILEKSSKVIDNIAKEYKFLDLRKKDDTFFKDKPWLVLGAGPSLHKQAEWIAKNSEKFIIIAAFTALNTLKRIGVKPDIAVQVDENVYTTHEMIKNFGDTSFLDDTLLFFSASVSPELIQTFKKENIYFHEDRTKYKLSKSTLTISSVGDTIYALSLIYNAPEVYLLGIDLALSDDGHTHSPDHFKARIVENSKTDEDNDDFQLDNSTMKVKGNFQETVRTTPLFTLSIPVINQFTQRYKSNNQIVYNLSDGCYFEQTTPLKVNDVQVEKKISKQAIYQEFKKYFDDTSETLLGQKEKDGIRCRIAQISDYYNYLIEFENTSHSNVSLFLESFTTIVNKMTRHACQFELRDIMTIYFMNTSSYVDDFFNTKEIQNHKKFTKKFKSILTKNIRNIISTYEKDLKKIESK